MHCFLCTTVNAALLKQRLEMHVFINDIIIPRKKSNESLAQLYLKKWWWPVASPGFGVSGVRRSRRRRREHRGAKGAEWCGVWGGVSAPQPTRGFGGASWALPAGSGAEPRPLSHFLHIFWPQNASVSKKYTILLQIPLWKSGGDSHHHFPKWWWQVTIVTYKVAPMEWIPAAICFRTANATIVAANN